MGIKEEFEKAFQDKVYNKPESQLFSRRCAVWAAKWMAERCAEHLDTRDVPCRGSHYAKEIRQLAKELS